MNAKRQPLTLIAFLIFAVSSWAQTAKPIDPLKFLTNFEAVPTEDGVLNLILHRGTGEVVLHVLDHDLKKVHEELYRTAAGIDAYIIKIKNRKVYILLNWLSNHNYKKELLEYSLADKKLIAHNVWGSRISKPADFLVFEENFAIMGTPKNPLVQIYSFDPSQSFRNTIYLPEKKIWHISDADNTINFLISPKENHQILEWQQYLPNGDFVGKLKLDGDFGKKDIESATLIIDSHNNPRVIGTIGEKKLKRYSAFFHWAMDSQNEQNFSIIEPQSLADRNNELDRKLRRQLRYEKKKGFNQVEFLYGLDGEILVASLPGKALSYPETIFKKQMVHFLHLDSNGDKIWDKLVDIDYTTRHQLTKVNYRRETFAYLLGDDFYFGHNKIWEEAPQLVNIVRIDKYGEATTFSQDLPPGLVYRIKHLGFNEVLLYNEAPLYQGEPQNLQYFMGKLKIQNPTPNLSNKN